MWRAGSWQNAGASRTARTPETQPAVREANDPAGKSSRGAIVRRTPMGFKPMALHKR